MDQKRRLSLLLESPIFGSLGLPTSLSKRKWFLLILSGEILSCTLWENYCIQFLSYLNERGDDGPMVIILTHARIKDAHGSYPASVINSFKASKLLINDPILEIQEFKERLLDLGVEVTPVLLPGDQASSQISGGS
ncbi:hypothetical protein D0Y65_053599, partial [Glycine soja]